jgi:hypothetical protein
MSVIGSKAGNICSFWVFRLLDPKLTSAEDADRRATEAESYDTCLPNIRIPRKVLKGGSHLCAQVVGMALFAVAHP